MRTHLSSGRVGLVSGILASGALAGGVLFANPAVTRHYWNFEGASPYSDKVGEAHAVVTQPTTVSLQTGHVASGQSMRTKASVGGANDFAAVYDPSLETDTLRFYLNGPTPSATASPGSVEAVSVSFGANCWLGTFNFTGTRENKGLDGMLDELACFADHLAPAQIQLLFDKEITPLDLAPPAFIVISYTRDAETAESTVVWNSSSFSPPPVRPLALSTAFTQKANSLAPA